MVDAQPSTFHQGGWQLTRKLTIIASTPALLGDSAVAQSDYPERPVTVVMPLAAGGPTDTVARLVAESMTHTRASGA
jgi:tripartite-type tricarboxylate transporter receptor subunit TctC